MSHMVEKARSRIPWGLFFKIGVTSLILGIVLWKNRENGPAFVHELKNSHLGWLLLSFFSMGLAIALSSFRWNFLLRVQQIFIPFPESWKLVMIGFFFNQFLPGSTGGDVIKIVYSVKHAPDRKALAVLSVVMDRILGLIAILGVTLLLLPLGYKSLADSLQAREMVIALGVILAAVLVGLALVLFFPLRKIPTFIQRLWLKVPRRDIAVSLYDGLQAHGKQKKHAVKALVFAAVTVIPILATGTFLAHTLSLDIAIGPMTILFALVLCAMSLPISVSGHGIREGMFTLMFGLFHVSRGGVQVGPETALAYSTLYLALNLAWSLIGGIVYLGYSHKNKKTDEEAEVPAAATK